MPDFRSHARWIRCPTGYLVIALLCTLTLAGCRSSDTRDDGPSGTVSGTVTFEEQPVTEGQVQFYSESSGAGGVGELDATGKFTIAQPVPTGIYKVFVTPPAEPAPESATGEFAEQREFGNIPEKYRSELSTDLTAEVKEGENAFEFDLKP